MSFKKVDIKDLKAINPFNLIGKEWMLVTAGSEEKFNTMTVSWGGMGVLWNKNVSFCFIRPHRFTFEFIESYEKYSLSFFEEKYKSALKICGTKSGRDFDKVKEANLTPGFQEVAPYFEEAKMVLICKKLYNQFIDPNFMLEQSLESNYPKKDYHKMYIGEIIKCMVKE